MRRGCGSAAPRVRAGWSPRSRCRSHAPAFARETSPAFCFASARRFTFIEAIPRRGSRCHFSRVIATKALRQVCAPHCRMNKTICLVALAPLLIAGCAVVPPPVTTADVRATSGAVVSREVVVASQPPTIRVETPPPAPGPRYAWNAGRWRWTGVDYEWTPGRWVVRPSPTAVWVEGRWQRRPGGWAWADGYWQ